MVDLKVLSEDRGDLKIGCSGLMTGDVKQRVFTFEIDGQVHQMSGESFRKMLQEAILSEEDIDTLQNYLCEDDDDSEYVDLDAKYENKSHEEIRSMLKRVNIHRLLRNRLKDQDARQQDIRDVERIIKSHHNFLRKNEDNNDAHKDNKSSFKPSKHLGM